MRPGNLRNLGDFWFGDDLTEEEKIGKRAEMSMARLTGAAGAAHIHPITYYRKKIPPAFYKYIGWKPLMVESPRDLLTPLARAAALKEKPVDEDYKPTPDQGPTYWAKP
jgi:hypothetical protein